MKSGLSQQRIPLFALLLANSVPLLGVLFFELDALDIVLAYLIETIVIGLIIPLKVLKAGSPSTSLSIDKTNEKNEAISLLVIFGVPFYSTILLMIILMPRFAVAELGVVFLVFLFSHGISYKINYIYGEEYKLTSPSKQVLIYI